MEMTRIVNGNVELILTASFVFTASKWSKSLLTINCAAIGTDLSVLLPASSSNTRSNTHVYLTHDWF